MKFNKWYVAVALMLLTMYSPMVVSASEVGGNGVTAFELNNNGGERSADEVFGHNASLPSSYSEVSDWVDVYIPYNMTLGQVGGDGTVQTPGSQPVMMSTTLKNSRVGDTIYSKSSSSAYGFSKVTAEVDNGMWIYADEKGNQYYGIFVSPFIVRAFGSGNEDIKVAFKNKLIDLVLTDGTVVHCLGMETPLIRGNTNGGDGETNPSIVGSSPHFHSPVKEQYRNIVHDTDGYIIGLSTKDVSASQMFINRYKLGSSNHIAFIRVYGSSLTTGKIDSVVNERSDKGVSTNYTATGAGSTVNNDIAMSNNDLSLVGGSMVNENELVGMHDEWSAVDAQGSVDLATRDGLSKGEVGAIVAIGDNVTLRKKTFSLDIMRIIAAFLGMGLMLYGFVLILALLFDKVNTFLEISIVGIVTLGRMKYNPAVEEGMVSASGYASSKKVIIRGVLLIIFGTVILSSGLTRITGWFLYKLMGLFN